MDFDESPHSISNVQAGSRRIFEGFLRTNLEQNLFTRLQRLMTSQPDYATTYIKYQNRFLSSIKLVTDLAAYKNVLRFKVMSFSFQLISDLAKYPTSNNTFMEVFEILFYHALTANNETCNFALLELINLIKYRQISLEKFFKINSRSIISCITKAIIHLINEGERRDIDVLACTLVAIEVFNQDTITQDVISHMMSQVAEFIGRNEHVKSARIIMESLASSQDMKPVTLINSHIQSILINLLSDRRLQIEDVKKVLDFLVNFPGASLESMLANKITFIKSRILLNYCKDDTSKKAVTDAIQFLDTRFDESSGPMDGELEDERFLIEYLRDSFIGILLGIDSHFSYVKDQLGDEETLKQIESLSYIINLFQPSEIQVIHVKLMSTLSLLIELRPARNLALLNQAICEIWYNFVRSMPCEVLASLVIQICVVLYDLIDDCPEQVSKIYRHMICPENEKLLEGRLKSLFFIPNVPSLREIYSYLNQFIKRDVHLQSEIELENLVDAVIPLVGLENQRCRILALVRLLEVVKKNIDLLHKIIFKHGDEPIDRLVSRIIQTLMNLSSYQDRETSSLIAECLGTIGAINPMRLDHLIFGETPGQPSIIYIQSNLEEDIFIRELIERLKNSLFSDKKDESEAASYALQVLVNIFNIYSTRLIFRLDLSSDALRACDLCKSTTFGATKRHHSEPNGTTFEKLKLEHNYSYKVWLHKFTLDLINSLGDSHGKVREVLNACSYIFRYNYLFAQFLLPYIIVHIIINDSNKMTITLEEITAIIEEDTGLSTQDISTATTEGDANLQSLHFQCANMIFSAMDFIFQLYSHRMSSRERIVEPATKCLAKFLSRINLEKLAVLAYRCKSYARALCYFEQFLLIISGDEERRKKGYDKYATTMQRIYVALDDSEEARGIDMHRTISPTVLDDISEHEASGHYDRAFINCTIAIQSNSDTDQYNFQKDALRCLALHGDFERLNEISRNYLKTYPILKQDIMPYCIESSWKLNKWDELDRKIRGENIEPMLDSIGVGLGALIHSLMNNSPVIDLLSLVRQRQMRPLSLAMIDKSAYFRGYQSLLSFHMINDLEFCLDIISPEQQLDERLQTLPGANKSASLDYIFAKWFARNNLIEPSLKSLEPILTLQRSLADMMKTRYKTLSRQINLNIGALWLHSARLSRESRSFERAHLCITQAQRFFTEARLTGFELLQKSELLLEKAKLHWDRNDKTSAIRGLKLALDRIHNHDLTRHLERRRIQRITAGGQIYPELGEVVQCADCLSNDLADREALAKLKLLLTYYCEESAAAMPGTLFDMYEELVHLAVDQEETYFRLARYYDRLLTYYIENPHLICEQNSRSLDQFDNVGRLSQSMVGDKEDVYTNLMLQSIYAFGNSLLFGVRYLRESMPRLLNIWYDLGSKMSTSPPIVRSTSSRIEESNRFITRLEDKLPRYYFMTAMSLILSRICHSHTGVAKRTAIIIYHLLQEYPHQVMWRLIAVQNDRENPERARAASNVLKQVKAVKQRKVIEDTLAVSKLLIEVCAHQLPRASKPGVYPVNQFAPTFEKVFLSKSLHVMVPTQKALTAVIPLDNNNDNTNGDAVFEPYPSHNQTFIVRFKPKLDVLSSMQRPRKLSLVCSDGRDRSLLCKPTDDLRKDSRCMEFFDLINKLLRRDRHSHNRFFEIQTFLVLPLTSVSGILEWLPNIAPLRGLIDTIYKQRNPKFNLGDLYGKKTSKEPTNDQKYQMFVTEVLPRCRPASLPMWFLRNFCEPTSWYMARLAYTRTTAVISMAGYIIGLGDRHLDNILVDTKTGRTVHVDFNLLFHQGEGLQVPERVPFRLTHNLVSTFGSLGHEGNFRSACEITLRVMRKEKDALLTTLKPFIHDPCSDWTRNIDHHGEKRSEIENLTAKEKIIDTERKLKGYPRSKFKPLSLIDSYSVEAQVDNLIKEATDNYNLSLMYHGWCPHI